MTAGQTKSNREYERIRENARLRLQQLARHKEPKIAFHTCVGPRVMWGTQEMLWPVSPNAMNGSATPRVQALATPKKDFQAGTVHEGRPQYYYSAGRSSVIWSVSDGAKQGSASERVQTLAEHKKYHPDWQEHKQQFYFSCGRASPIWTVPGGATQCSERPRTTQLAEHRKYHSEFQGERPVQSVVSAAARLTKASDHVTNLALPKSRPDGPFRDPQWPVSDQAKSAVASARCMELARAKPLAEGFQHAKEIEWPVSKAAKRAQASGRLLELARPITRASMDHLQFNPNAFAVKESALKGGIPRRIEELAQPINR
ncbi:sperm microtubule associated protein 2-like isoform X2 [Babylonia areolata]|uniref:sperm microtubule associated protein 2-like isoform X2 n=1 Tax=Babylonia areolata TaxID=304850 RepID=UPI003FCF073E